MRLIKRAWRKLLGSLRAALSSPPSAVLLQEAVAELVRHTDQLTDVIGAITRNQRSLSRFGRQVFSQSDEDGITLELVSRVFEHPGIVLELGVGDGIENNSLVLLAAGWRAVWIGDEDMAFAVEDFPDVVAYERSWVTRDNVNATVAAGLTRLGALHGDVDILMVDLDGNDLHVTRALLEGGCSPRALVVEYNSYLPPPISWVMEYDPAHVWTPPSLNYGASLQAYVDLLAPRGYMLVGCNAQTGNNAFFVHTAHAERFADVSREVGELYVGRAQTVYNTPHNKKRLSRDFVESVLRTSRRG